MSQQTYRNALDGWEVVTAVFCGAPGFLVVGLSQLRSRQKSQQEAETTKKQTDIQDETIWPPPPHE